MSFFSNFKDFFKPDDYKAQPYPYLVNQVGHVFLGFTATTWYTWLLCQLSGTYPSQVMAFFVCVVIYGIVWEVLCQGWRKFDTIEDTAFFGMGSSVYLFIHMEWVIDRIAVYLLFIGFFVSVGTISRIKDTN